MAVAVALAGGYGLLQVFNHGNASA
eukprot:COSAG05_NODE_24427_length_251_cov_1.019737_1_plen_24_part_01